MFHSRFLRLTASDRQEDSRMGAWLVGLTAYRVSPVMVWCLHATLTDFYWPLARLEHFKWLSLCSVWPKIENENVHEQCCPRWTHFIMDADVVQVQVKVILLTCYLTIYCRIGAQFAVRWALLLFSVICCSCCSSCATSGTSSTSSSCRSCSAGWAAAPCAGLVAFTGQRLGRAGNCK